jgi:hypothetical protein
MASAESVDVAKRSVEVPMYKFPPIEENNQCFKFVPAPLSESTRFFPVVVAIWSVANGVEVPRPKFPTDESK